MKIKSFIDQAKLDLSDMYFEVDSGTGYRVQTEIHPEDFVTFAKADFFNADTRALVNALSNAKRAIDCQTDNFLIAIGLDPDNLDKQLGPCGLASIAYGGLSNDGPLKYRLLRALGIATPEIVVRLRRLRNLLEHDYKRPRRADVSRAIDIADLFVQACRGKLQAAFDTVGFGSGKVKLEHGVGIEKQFTVRFELNSEPIIEAFYFPHEWENTNPKQIPPSIKLKSNEEGYVPLLKLLWHTGWDNDMTEPLKAFLAELGYRLPSRFRVRRPDM